MQNRASKISVFNGIVQVKTHELLCNMKPYLYSFLDMYILRKTFGF